MIPPFNDAGCLPPGVHRATLREIEARLGHQSEPRRAQIESLHWLIDLARRAGIERIILNGSFVTDIIEPIDVDCVLLIPEGFPKDPVAETDLRKGLPYLDIALADEAEFSEFIRDTFATDRAGEPKGMIEVIQWI